MHATALVEERCVACRADSPRLTTEELSALSAGIPCWEIAERNGSQRLQRAFRFPDFRGALIFSQRVGELAEAEGHHPALLTEWGRVRVTWTTHAIHGLHRNDVLMAAKTDQLFETVAGALIAADDR